MKRIVTLLTTYNRRAMCLELLRSIAEEQVRYRGEHEHTLLIFDDGSEPSYAVSMQRLMEKHGIGGTVLRNPYNGGKAYYWQAMNVLMSYLRDLEYDYVVQLADDLALTKGFYEGAMCEYESIMDRRKGCLNLYRDFRDECWGSGPAVDHNFRGKVFRETGWVDMCYIATPTMMEALDYTLEPIKREWDIDPSLGSGVGQQISIRLRNAGLRLWQVNKSLVIDEGHHESKMNPQRKAPIKAL